MTDTPGKIQDYVVGPEHEAKRLDQYVSEIAEMTRSQAQKLIESGHVWIRGHPAKKNHKVKAGERIEVEPLPEEADTLISQDIDIDIVFKDDHLIVVNKPPGMVMYPAAGHVRDTLMNAIAFCTKKRASIGSPLRPGVVHRLDKDTSGLLVIALDDMTYYALQKQFRERTVEREYLAIVHGRPRRSSGEIDFPIGRAASDRKKMSTKTRRGKEAITYYTVHKEFSSSSLIKARLATGRTHQIRVHFASTGHPVLGDRTYGKKITVTLRNRKLTIPRQMLHAATLGFVHPVTGKKLSFTSPMPDDMEAILKLLQEG